jgi:hypothetical protein
MKNGTRITKISRLVASVMLSVGLLTGPAQADKKLRDQDIRFVDCDKGRTIDSAITQAKAGRQLLVIVSGTCTRMCLSTRVTSH